MSRTYRKGLADAYTDISRRNHHEIGQRRIRELAWSLRGSSMVAGKSQDEILDLAWGMLNPAV